MGHQKTKSRSLKVNGTAIRYTNKPITSWGGLTVIMGGFFEKINFKAWVESNVPIQEHSNNSRGIYEKVLATFLTVLSGGERFSHVMWWNSGIAAIKPVFAVDWLPKAASTLSRFWNKISRQSLSEKLLENGRNLATEILEWEGISEGNLNFDSSVLTRYGEQDGAKKGYNPKKKGRGSHHPLLAFLSSGYIVNFWNRSGDTSSGQGVKDFLVQTLHILGESFKVKRVLCDSGFYLIELITYLEEKCLSYIISTPISPIIQQQIEGIKQWERVVYGIEVAEFEFEHFDRKWTKPRRYVVVRQEKTKRPKALGKQPSLFKDLPELKNYRYSVMITNDHDSEPVEIWREYRPRAKDENVIKNLKYGYGFEAFNMNNFWATEAILGMILLVLYNLVHYLNRTVLNIKGPKEHLKTIRFKYFAIPAIFEITRDQSILRLGIKGWKSKKIFSTILNRIQLNDKRLKCIAVESL